MAPSLVTIEASESLHKIPNISARDGGVIVPLARALEGIDGCQSLVEETESFHA